jgi:ribosomal protein L7/L12
MKKIIMKGWREGMEKVSLSKLQIELLGKSLKEAKNNVDMLLEGEIITIDVENNNIAKRFVDSANKIGVDCLLEE